MFALFALQSVAVGCVSSRNHAKKRKPYSLLRGSILGLLLIGIGSGVSAGISAFAQGKSDAPTNNGAAASLGPNLLTNGDFARGATGWTPQLTNGKAVGTVAWPSDAPMPDGAIGKVARFEVEAIDKERWHVQFYQDRLDLNDNETYTLTFRVRAEQQRLLSLSVNTDEEDYHPIGLDDQVSIGPQWQKISLAFTALRTRKNHSRLSFMLGEALGRVELADVRLQKGVVAPPPGPNLLRNANFMEGTTSWLPLITEANAQATLQVMDEASANVTGKVVRVNVTEAGSQPWHAYFGQSGLPLEEGAVYTLSFLARSKSGRSFSVHSDVEGGDYHQTGFRQIVALTPNWNKFTFVFTPTNTGGSKGRIIFSVGDGGGDVDLAGVVLQRGAMPQATAPAVNPNAQTSRVTGQGATRARRSHPLVGTWQSFHKEEGLTGREYQRYRFVFEPNGGGSLQVATMSADPVPSPKSQNTEQFKWDLIAGGPHVSIGANVYTWTIEKDGAKQKLTLKNYEGKTYILFRQ